MRVMYFRWRSILSAVAVWCFLTFFTYVCLKEEPKLSVPHQFILEPNDVHLREEKRSRSYQGEGLKSADNVKPSLNLTFKSGDTAHNYSQEVWRYVNTAVKMLYMNKEDSVESVFEKLDIDPGGNVEEIVRKVLTKLQFMARKPWRPPNTNDTEVGDIAEEVDKEGDGQEKSLTEELSAWKRSMAYCNPPETITPGQEGSVPPSYKMENVHIIIRHGDRSPMYSLPQHQFLRLRCDLELSSLSPYYNISRSYVTAMKKLLQISPSGSTHKRFGVYPHSSLCVGAQLTGNGAVQHLLNGKFLHDAYVKKWGLISETNFIKDIHVRSTEYTRTYQSAVAFLYGLLPDVKKISAIPIELSSFINFCSTPLTGLTCYCPMVNRMKAIIKKEKARRNQTAHNDIKKEVAKVFDSKPAKLPWIGATLEVLLGYICHGAELPCNQHEERKCVSWNMVNSMWKVLDATGKKEISSYSQHRLSRLQMHPLMHEIAHRMLNRTRKYPGPKLALYSGHDITVTPLLMALGIYDGLWAPYGSRIVFEMYSKDKQYFMKVLYNGKDKTADLRFCADVELVDGLCPLDNFLYYVLYRDIQYFKKATYADACAV